jgi:hypothetical protein
LDDRNRSANSDQPPLSDTSPSNKSKSLSKSEVQAKAASLVEQLFPEETKRYQAQRANQQDVSRSTPESQTVPSERDVPLMFRRKMQEPKFLADFPAEATNEDKEEYKKIALRRIIHVRNVSVHLTEDDFRRLVPRGEHIEGWRSDRDDIIRAIPLRDPKTLQHKGEYYLLFHDLEAARSYNEHARQIQTVAARHTPKSEYSGIPAAPGHREDGVDIDSVVRAYTVALPTQPLNMTMVPLPYEGEEKLLVTYCGVPPYQRRNGRTPFEVRFTMEGPQLTIGALRHIIMEDGIERGQSWSGTESKELTIWEWDPWSSSPITEAKARDLAQADTRRAASPRGDKPNPKTQRRTPNTIFLISFATKEAAQSFVCYWHRRTIEKQVIGHLDIAFATDAPVADVQYI